MRRTGLVLIGLALVACNSGKVVQPDEIEIGKLHNEALAWVLADLQAAKVRLGSAWNPGMHMSVEADRSMIRFLDRHPEVNRVIYYQMKNQFAAAPMAASIFDSDDLAQLPEPTQTVVQSVYVASDQYWTEDGHKWAELAGLQVFPSAMRQSAALKRIALADAYGAIGGFAAGGPAGAVAGAVAASLGTAIGIVIGGWLFSPGVTL